MLQKPSETIKDAILRTIENRILHRSHKQFTSADFKRNQHNNSVSSSAMAQLRIMRQDGIIDYEVTNQSEGRYKLLVVNTIGLKWSAKTPDFIWRAED